MESLANVLVAIESNPAKLFYKNSTAFNLSFLVYIPTSNLLYLGQILSVPPKCRDDGWGYSYAGEQVDLRQVLGRR